MNKPQSIDGIIGPRHAGPMSHRAGFNRALKAEAAQSVRRAFNQDIADQLAADIDCTEPLSPVCDCRVHSGYDDTVNLLADVQRLMPQNGTLPYAASDLDHEFDVVGSDWWIGVMSGHDEEYLGFRRLPSRIPYSITALPGHFNGLCWKCRGEQ